MSEESREPPGTPARAQARAPARTPARAVDALLLAGSLLGVAMVVYGTAPFGPGLNQFGIHNITAAEGLRTGVQMQESRNGVPFMAWPPLFPALLALGRSLGLSYPAAGLAINALAHGAILFLSSKLLLQLFGSARLALANLAILLLLPNLLRDAASIHPEPLFNALVLACLCAFARYLERPDKLHFALVTVTAAVACLQRYVGVSLVLAVALSMLFLAGTGSWISRCRRALVFALLAVVPLVPWMLRNLSINHTLTGNRAPARQTFGENSRDAASTLGRWLGPDVVPVWVWPWIVALALVLVGLVVARIRVDREERERRARIVYLAFPAVYLATLIGVASIITLDELNGRLLIPLYSFLWGTLLIGAADVRWSLARFPGWIRVAALVPVLAFFAGSLVSGAVDSWRTLAGYRQNGVGGFGARSVQESPLVEWLRTHPVESAIYCNVPELVIVATGKLAIQVDTESLARALASAPEEVCVVWTNYSKPRTTIPDLSTTGRSVSCLMESKLGAVYRVGRAQAERP